jgi:hypothetical protein
MGQNRTAGIEAYGDGKRAKTMEVNGVFWECF